MSKQHNVSKHPAQKEKAELTILQRHDDADVQLAIGNANNKSQLSTRRDRYCNPTNLAPNLPHGPYLCGFPNQNVYNAAAVGVLDAFTLARAALRVLARCGQTGEEASLTRYFDIGTSKWF